MQEKGPGFADESARGGAPRHLTHAQRVGSRNLSPRPPRRGGNSARTSFGLAKESAQSGAPGHSTHPERYGTSVLTQGWHEEAEGMLRKVWVMLEKVLGEHHPDTLRTQSTLAVAIFSVAGAQKRRRC